MEIQISMMKFIFRKGECKPRVKKKGLTTIETRFEGKKIVFFIHGIECLLWKCLRSRVVTCLSYNMFTKLAHKRILYEEIINVYGKAHMIVV